VATVTGDGTHIAAAAVEPQQVVASPTAAMTTAVTTSSVPPALAPIDDSQAGVVRTRSVPVVDG
jgi:hypothetical protein